MTTEISLNDVQQLYVIKTVGGYSCFGYQNAFRDATAMAEMLELEKPDVADFGTMKVYDRYRELVKLFAASPVSNQTWYTPGTLPRVKSVLENARSSDRRIMITLGDIETGLAWDDEPSRGTVGRSMGAMKIPLLISRRSAHGGESILTDCVIRIQDSKTKKDLYVHPTFHVDKALIDQPIIEQEEAAAPTFR